MPNEQVVINASPLICLGKAGLLHILPSLFDCIAVPAAVMRELSAPAGEDPVALAVRKSAWLQRKEIIPIDLRVAAWDLGAGESEVISFALHTPGFRPVLDDREARRCAETLGCRVVGTAGILLMARRQNLIPSLRQAFAQLKQAGLWVSDSLINEICLAVGE